VGDWRVTVRLDDHSRHGGARTLKQLMDAVHARLGEPADISANKSGLFVYSDSEATAIEAASAARDLLGPLAAEPVVTVERWNPLTTEWDADLAASSPSDSELADAERRHRIADDTDRSQATGVPAWTVRAAFGSRGDAIELARRLGSLGLPVVRRGKSVLLGASNEDVADELVQRVAEQGRMATVSVQRTLVWAPPVDCTPLF